MAKDIFDAAVSQATMNKAQVLRGHFLLQHLDAADIELISLAATVVRFVANEVIFRQGESKTDLIIIVSGRVKLGVTSSDGQELLVNIAESGNILGEIAVIDGRPRSHDATALEATEALVVHRKDLIPFLQRRPEVCIRLMAVLCERLRRGEGLVHDTVFLRVGPRLARQLLRLAQAYGRPEGSAVWIDTKISQRDLACLVGMSRESINKQLCAWRHLEFLWFRGKSYKILDIAALRRVAE